MRHEKRRCQRKKLELAFSASVHRLSFCFSLRDAALGFVKMYFDKMLVKQVFKPLLLLIQVRYLMGSSELYILTDRAMPPEGRIALSPQDLQLGVLRGTDLAINSGGNNHNLHLSYSPAYLCSPIFFTNADVVPCIANPIVSPDSAQLTRVPDVAGC